jgi:hypothetical protein
MAGGVTIDGVDSFETALKTVEDLVMPEAERAIGESLEELRKIMAPYPPQPDRDRANQNKEHPSPYNTYVRGIGQFPRSSFAQVDGAWGRKKKGAYKKGPKGGKVRRTSQNLKKKWNLTVKQDGNAVSGVLENTASYSGVVLGHKQGSGEHADSIPDQAPFHADTGWMNIDDGMTQVQPKIDRAFRRVIDRVMQKLRGS